MTTDRIGPDPIPDSAAPGAHIWGWMAPAELEWLAATAATMNSVAEIGCLHGRSSFALLTGCPGLVYCIDPWDDPARESFPSFLSNVGHFPNMRAIAMRSPAAADRVPNVDMVFLDGGHDLLEVTADIRAWRPKTRRLLCGHDYNHPGFPGVRAAVDVAFGDRVRPAVGDSWDDGNMSIWTVWLDDNGGV